jgi:hypothetical protein
VAAASAVLPDPQTAWFQIQVVVYHHQRIGSQTEFAKETLDGGATEVHPVESSGEFN